MGNLEQAKKRDHKIFITDTAIEKVSLVKPSDFSYSQASLMKSKHKELLNVAKKQNNSNEVLFIENLDYFTNILWKCIFQNSTLICAKSQLPFSAESQLLPRHKM